MMGFFKDEVDYELLEQVKCELFPVSGIVQVDPKLEGMNAQDQQYFLGTL